MKCTTIPLAQKNKRPKGLNDRGSILAHTGTFIFPYRPEYRVFNAHVYDLSK
jgi:hypothetical protein